MKLDRRRLQLAYSEARLRAFRRSLSACEGCGHRLHPEAFHAHHRLPRAPVRIDCPCNLLVLCHRCHEAVHKTPARSRELGRIIARYDSRVPCEVPAFVRRDWVLLDHEGGRTPDLSRVSCDTQRQSRGDSDALPDHRLPVRSGDLGPHGDVS